MKITFTDNSYVDCYKSTTSDKIIIAIQAKDYDNPKKKITNAIELTSEQFKQLISNIEG